ncbi:MAG: HlyD family type I secretion periplasmic adaptor subunit [Pseudomonadota bacterium]
MGLSSALAPVPAGATPAERIEESSRKIVSRSHLFFVLLIGGALSGFGLWSQGTQIDIVTRGSGQVVPKLQNQFVQHLEGGIVSEILVTEGQLVAAGDVLMRISDSFSEAEFLRTSQQLISARAELARLDAETASSSSVTFPDDLRLASPAAVEDQAVLFERRRLNIEQRILVLEDQLRRTELKKREMEAKLENTRREFELMNERVSNLGALAQSGATSRNELLRNQLDLQEIRSRLSDLAFQIPQVEVEINEARQRQAEIRLDFVATANAEKIETLKEIEQLETTLLALKDRESRTEVRAPIDGKIHRLFQTTVGGVVQGGQNLIQIVPTDATISIEIALSPKDRGRVWTGLPAVVKLTAYDFSIYGGIDGEVANISSDILRGETGEPYYKVTLEADTAAFAGREIVPGMAADVDIITGQRSVIDYILSPIRDIQENALREP